MYNIAGINYRLILRFLSVALFILAGITMITGIVGVLYNEKDYVYFFVYTVFLIIAAILLIVFIPLKGQKSINIRDSFLIILFLWIILPVLGMLPFLIISPINNITDALFESFAGFTTTGFSTLTEYENVSKSIIFWRAIIQWLGGMGILILIIAIIPFFGRGNVKIFFSDLQDVEFSPLHQRIGKTAKSLWYIYIIYSVFGIIALYIAGQDIFDSVIYSFAAISTGGGVPVNGNLTHLSFEVKTVIMVLMLVAGANYFFLFKSVRKFKIIKSEEINVYFLILIISFVLIAVAGILNIGYSNTLLFESLFNTVSFVSTTGFYSAEVFTTKILFIWVVLFFLLFIGSSTGSSGGGINVYRIIVLAKMVINYIKELLHPNLLNTIKLDKKPVSFKIIHSIIGFFVLYMLIFIVGAFILTIFGYNMENAFSLCAASLSNTGPGVFLLDEYFCISDINIGAKYTVMFLMIIGRVELFPILIVFSKVFWKR